MREKRCNMMYSARCVEGVKKIYLANHVDIISGSVLSSYADFGISAYRNIKSYMCIK